MAQASSQTGLNVIDTAAQVLGENKTSSKKLSPKDRCRVLHSAISLGLPAHGSGFKQLHEHVKAADDRSGQRPDLVFDVRAMGGPPLFPDIPEGMSIQRKFFLLGVTDPFPQSRGRVHWRDRSDHPENYPDPVETVSSCLLFTWIKEKGKEGSQVCICRWNTLWEPTELVTDRDDGWSDPLTWTSRQVAVRVIDQNDLGKVLGKVRSGSALGDDLLTSILYTVRMAADENLGHWERRFKAAQKARFDLGVINRTMGLMWE